MHIYTYTYIRSVVVVVLYIAYIHNGEKNAINKGSLTSWSGLHPTTT